MSGFRFEPQDVVTLFTSKAGDEIADQEKNLPGLVKAGLDLTDRRTPRVALSSDRPGKVDLEKQFVVFHLNPQAGEQAVLESSEVEPSLGGSRDEPDVLVALEMLSFHVGAKEKIDEDTRATMRINFGKDVSSTDKRFNTVFWSIAAGLNLYSGVKGRPPEGLAYKTDLREAFGNRPIEIPGGLGRLSFEVIKHKEPEWWQRIFKFFRSDTGKTLISVLGFPAISYQAIEALDELLNRLGDSEPEPLFRSMPMRLALSSFARDEFTGGNARVKLGSLRPGFCVLARGRDFSTLVEADVMYYPTHNKLAPRSISQADLVAGGYEDPLVDVTYAVFRVALKQTRLDPTFNYNA